MSNIQSFWESFFPPARWRTKPVDVVKDEDELILDMTMKILVALLMGPKWLDSKTLDDHDLTSMDHYVRCSFVSAELMLKEHKKRIEQKRGAK